MLGTLFIEPGSPWENGYVESFKGKLRSELLYGVFFETLLEAKVLIERSWAEYNTVSPHNSGPFRCKAVRGRPIDNLNRKINSAASYGSGSNCFLQSDSSQFLCVDFAARRRQLKTCLRLKTRRSRKMTLTLCVEKTWSRGALFLSML